MNNNGFTVGGPSRSSGLMKSQTKQEIHNQAFLPAYQPRPVSFTELSRAPVNINTGQGLRSQDKGSSLGVRQQINPTQTDDMVPFSCMVDLIRNYSNCGERLTEQQEIRAFEIFRQVTGYEPVNIEHIVDSINSQDRFVVNFTGFYMFIPILLLALIGLLLAIVYSWINWADGLYLMSLAIAILYGFNMLYRTLAINSLNNDGNILHEEADRARLNLEHSVAYLPQAMYAIACAITTPSNIPSWVCNGILDGGEEEETPNDTVNNGNNQTLPVQNTAVAAGCGCGSRK